MQSLLKAFVNFTRAFSALISSPLLFKTKKGGSVVSVWHFYGRFLTAVSIRTPTIAIATIIATAATPMYISVGGNTVTGYGDAVAGAALAYKAVVADDP